jgi:hypothetical protein
MGEGAKRTCKGLVSALEPDFVEELQFSWRPRQDMLNVS